jgi:hypothetical protein
MPELHQVISQIVLLASVAILGWYLKNFIGTKFKKEHEDYKNLLATARERDLETLRSTLKDEFAKHETLFTRLRDLQVEVISEVFKRLVRLKRAIDQFLSDSENLIGRSDEDAHSAFRVFSDYLEENYLHLPKAAADELLALQSDVKDVLDRLDYLERNDPTFSIEKGEAHWLKVRDRLTHAKGDIALNLVTVHREVLTKGPVME